MTAVGIGCEARVADALRDLGVEGPRIRQREAELDAPAH